MSAKKKIVVVTGTRAEYGLLRPLMQLIQSDNQMELQLLVTGTHLSALHGNTLAEITKDGFTPTRTIDILKFQDSNLGIGQTIGLATAEFSKVFDELQPDLVILLGDRFEAFAVATAATVMHIPIAHLHGGELTFGAIDEAFRHAITKMAHLHFTSADEYAKRVIAMGEQPDRVFNTGAIGIDTINSIKFLTKEELENDLKFKFAKINFLVTFHPETIGDSSQKDFAELLSALDVISDATIIFTYPNADAGGNALIKMIDAYVASNKNRTSAFASLGQLRYLSILKNVQAVVGNSSSGIIEAPALKIPTVNIGDRQEGRIRANSVLDCAPIKNEIVAALHKIVDPEFIASCNTNENPYGNGTTATQIMNVIRKTDLKSLLKKKFYDVR